jgi:hypothetical protein
VRPEYRWSWRNAQLEQDLYIRTIRRSNMSGREARAALGIALANHLLSAVDAVITLRVEGLEGGTGRGFAVRGSLPIPRLDTEMARFGREVQVVFSLVFDTPMASGYVTISREELSETSVAHDGGGLCARRASRAGVHPRMA